MRFKLFGCGFFSAPLMYIRVAVVAIRHERERNRQQERKLNTEIEYYSHQPIKFSCNMFLELVKNGRNDGFGVDPTDKLSMSGPESSPSQHDNESNS